MNIFTFYRTFTFELWNVIVNKNLRTRGGILYSLIVKFLLLYMDNFIINVIRCLVLTNRSSDDYDNFIVKIKIKLRLPWMKQAQNNEMELVKYL